MWKHISRKEYLLLERKLVVCDYMANQNMSTNLQAGQFFSALSSPVSLDGDYSGQRRGKVARQAESEKIDRITANVGDRLADISCVSRMRWRKIIKWQGVTAANYSAALPFDLLLTGRQNRIIRALQIPPTQRPYNVNFYQPRPLHLYSSLV